MREITEENLTDLEIYTTMKAVSLQACLDEIKDGLENAAKVAAKVAEEINANETLQRELPENASFEETEEDEKQKVMVISSILEGYDLSYGYENATFYKPLDTFSALVYRMLEFSHSWGRAVKVKAGLPRNDWYLKGILSQILKMHDLKF